jgi:hypothetical protein
MMMMMGSNQQKTGGDERLLKVKKTEVYYICVCVYIHIYEDFIMKPTKYWLKHEEVKGG